MTAHVAQRIFCIGIGAGGVEALQALQERIRERLATPEAAEERLAFLGLGSTEAADASFPLLAMSDTSEPLPEQVATLRQAIVEAVDRISRAPTDLRPDTPLLVADIDVYVVVDVTDPAAKWCVDVTYLVRHVLRTRFTFQPFVFAFLLLPDPVCEEDSEKTRRAMNLLNEIEGYLHPEAAYQRAYREGTVVEEGGPVFDGPCFLVAALNEHRLHVGDMPSRAHLIAEMMYQLAMEGGQRNIVGIMPAWGMPGYAAFGLAALVYPARTCREHLARRLASQVLRAWAGEPPTAQPERDRPRQEPSEAPSGTADHTAAAVTRFLGTVDVSPESLGEQLLPWSLLEERGVAIPVVVPPLITSPHTLKAAVDKVVSRQLAALETCSAERSGAVAEKVKAVRQAISSRTREELRRSTGGAVCSTVAFVRRLRAALTGHIHSAKVRQAEAERRLSETREAAEREGAALLELADRLAKVGLDGTTSFWKVLLRLLLWPWRLPGVWRLAQAFRRARVRYIRYRDEEIRLAVDVARARLAHKCLVRIANAAGTWEKRLAALSRAVEEAATTIEQENTAELESRIPFEWPVITPQEAETHFQDLLPSPDDILSELLSEGDFVDRVMDAMEDRSNSARVIADETLSFTRERLHMVSEMSVGKVLALRYPRDEDREALLERLVHMAAPLLVWDATLLKGEERDRLAARTMLAVPVPDQDMEELQRVKSRLQPAGVVLPVQDRHRIVVMRMLHGLPLKAVSMSGIAEAHAAAAQAREEEEPPSLGQEAAPRSG